MFRVKRKQLADELALLVSIAGQKNVIPALSCVRFKVEDDRGMRARLLASNSEVALFTEVLADGDWWSGCIPAKPLYDLIRLASSVEDVIFEEKGGLMVISWDRSRHRLPVIRFEDFPDIRGPIAGGSTVSVKGDELQRSIERVLPCVSTGDTSNYNLKGVKFEAKDRELKMIGTNSHRLGVATIACDGEIDVLVPTAAAILLPRLESEDVMIWKSEHQAAFNYGPRTLITRLPTGVFPSWKLFIPADLPITASADTKEMIGAFRRADITRDETFKTGVGKILLGVVLIFGKDELVIDTKHSDVHGRSEESVGLVSNMNGSLIYMGMNPDYVMDFLRLAGEQTECGLKDGSSVLKLSDRSNFEYYVVPQSLRERPEQPGNQVSS